MNNLEFISQVISSLIWPTTVLSVIVIMRRPIQNLLSTLRFKYGGFEFEVKLREAKTIAESIEPITNDSQKLLNDGAIKSMTSKQAIDAADNKNSITHIPAAPGDIFSKIFIDDMFEIANQGSPYHAIHMAWGALEKRLKEIAGNKKIIITYYSARNRKFRKFLKIINPKVSELIIKLSEIFDDVNANLYSVTSIQAREFIDMALNVIRQLAIYAPVVVKEDPNHTAQGRA